MSDLHSIPPFWATQPSWELWVKMFFDCDLYMDSYRDIAEAAVDPLLHFVETGWRELHSPNALFDARWYAATYLRESDENPFAYYLTVGEEAGMLPRPEFAVDTVLAELAQSANAPVGVLVFINAWNEWADGAAIEGLGRNEW